MAVNNSTILSKAWLSGTYDYQQRIPEPTQSNISNVVDSLFDPMNRNYYNQFVDTLVNRIGLTLVKNLSYKNPLSVFKGSNLLYGSTIQEIAPKWIKAHSYDPSTTELLKLHKPEAQVWYHSQDRQDQYPISISYDDLRTAFVDEYGINTFISTLMQAPINSDEYDEYQIMVSLLAEYEKRWGFFKVQLSAAPTTQDACKELLTYIRSYRGKLQFPSTMYNAKNFDVPVFAKPEELVLLYTPEVSANIDVQTLASVFQLDKADIQVRTILVNEFPIPNAYALLTTSDFFVAHDTLYNTTNFYNPQTLTNNYFLNHWGVYSVSPFTPAILFTTDASTDVTVLTESTTGFTVNVVDDSDATITALKPGNKYKVVGTLAGTITTNTDDVIVAPSACTYNVTVTGDGVTDSMKSRTYVDTLGYIHIPKNMPTTAAISLKCVSTYINPSGTTADYSATVALTIQSN